MRLHREGKRLIPLTIMFVVIVTALGYLLYTPVGNILAIAGLVLIGLVINFFRNPDVRPLQNPNHILAPCDGKVVVVEEVEDTHYLKQKVRQISIFMSPLNVHVNRNPITGTVRYFKYLPGKYLMAFNPKSSTDNEQTYIVASNDQVTVAWKQIAGFLARRIRWYIKEGDALAQGAEFGFIRFGSRIDILIPLECEVKVDLKQKTKAGVTVIAELPKSR